MSAGQSAPALSIYTDASYLDGNGGWAAVMVRGPEDFRIISGRLKQGCPSSTHAEFFAVCNALHMVTRHTPRPESIVVYTDCRTLVPLCTTRRVVKKRLAHKWEDGLAKFGAIMDKIAAPVEFRWIKGHQPAVTACDHAQFNRMADRAAGEHNGSRERKRAQRARWRKARRERKALARAHDANAQRLDHHSQTLEPSHGA